jgi:hypothetical protein
MLFYSASITPRLKYITQALFGAIGVDRYEITTDIDSFKAFTDAKINYSSCSIAEQGLWIEPALLLFETDVKPQAFEVFQWNSSPAFYKTSGHFPFDVFAASFYLLSRYEEYLPHELDVYGRYSHENSLAFTNNFLQLPVVNIWLKQFSNVLQQKFPALSLTPAKFSFLPTYDIDIAWSYLNKGLLRNAGGLLRSAIKGKWEQMQERISVLRGDKNDPFYCYSWLNYMNQRAKSKPIYFFLVAKRNRGYDKNILPSNKNYRKLIKNHASHYDVGIHPSWQSYNNNKELDKELECLEEVVSKSITKSRQHYIKMKLPDTYRNLIEVGITEDYSMGYGSVNGFRASYCLPYKWYDLERDKVTALTIYPFCYMEANSYFEQHYTAQQALEEMEQYYAVTKDVNGLLVTIWHNHFLGTDKMFEGWKEVYEEFLRKHFY